MKKFIKINKVTVSVFAIIMLIAVYALSVNFYVLGSAQKQIVKIEEMKTIEDVDAVLVLGCGVKPDGTPSRMLIERVLAGSDAFKNSDAKTLLLSGDKSGESYDESGVMKSLAIENEIEEKNITLDNVGYSTFESIYNAKNIYNVRKIIIITQPYHLARALYIARSLGLEAYGYEAYLPFYPRQIIWSLREVAARNKDFLKCNLKFNEGGNEK